MFGQMAKWVAQIDRTERIPEFIARAFAVATSGRPGPVVLALPEDTLWGKASVPDMPRYQRARSAPAPAALDALQTLLAGARRPFLLVGGSGWTAAALRDRRPSPSASTCRWAWHGAGWSASTITMPTMPAMSAGAWTMRCARASATPTC